MILDVGCGGKPVGHVNCDIHFGQSPHTVQMIKKCDNFLLADAHYLPFKDDAFSIVHASQVLEHLKRPYDALAEWKRVSRKYVYIHVPNAQRSRGVAEQHGMHIYGWDKFLLGHLLREVFPTFQVWAVRSKPLHGQRFDRLPWIIRQIISFVFGIIFANQLTAICQVEGSL